MQKTLIIKGAIIAFLCLLFLVGLQMVAHLVYERQSYQEQVIDEIKQTHIGDQRLMTPFLELNHTAVYGQAPVTSTFFASSSDTTGRVQVSDDTYKRGIYRAISYQATLHTEQHHDAQAIKSAGDKPPANYTPNAPKAVASATPAPASDGTTAPVPAPTPAPVHHDTIIPSLSLVIPVSDLRGVSLPVVTINGKPYQAGFGGIAGLPSLTLDISDLLVRDDSGQIGIPKLDIKYDLSLSGIGALEFAPIGQSSTVALSGNWQAPKFYGDVLPPIKSFSDAGFSASWDSPFLAQQNITNLSCDATDCASNVKYLGVDFVDENNSYVRVDRSIKYALLLLLVSFGTFFLFEVVRSLKIHPVQYGLVAAALLTFYVLLLSLSEYLLFWQAYAIASAACVTLIGWYASFMLLSKVRALMFMGILGGLYALFYTILTVTEFNLLLGAGFCFALVFVAMFVTRKIDWYGVR